VDFHGERRTNATRASTTNPEARLYKKAKLCSPGHALMDNRHGLVVDTCVTQATGTAERESPMAMVEAIPGRHHVTLGADKNYDTRDFVHELRKLLALPHVAQYTTGHSSAINGRTTRNAGYTMSQQRRKQAEEVFGWMKTVGLPRKTRYSGGARVGWMFTLAAAVYNLVRLHMLAAVA
jgi:hypothetical protein